MDDRNQKDLYPGYFKPILHNNTIYTRWGYTPYPRGITAINRTNGQALWTNEPPYPQYTANRYRLFTVPVGDPTFSDNLLYYLEWQATHSV